MSDAPEQNEQQQLNQPALTTEVQEEREEQKEATGTVDTESETKDTTIGKGEAKADGTNAPIDTAASETRRNSEDEVDHALGTGGAATPKEADGDIADQGTAPVSTQTTEAVTESAGPMAASSVVEAADAAPSPSVTHTSLRPASPSSRTSTPPLTGTAAPVAKKFSAINVNKKFLSKTGSTPSPSNASTNVKLNPMSNRPISSPVPIVAPSSRLLSTKLTTTSASTKPPVSPQPTSSASTSSPWARPSLPPAEAPGSAGGQRSYGGQPGSAGSLSTPLGQGQGPGSARPAWRAVTAEGKRGPMGMARDFPTAKEVADGKKAAATAAVNAAQAQAAHAAAILHNLDAFSHLDHNGHSWVDDDDEDDIIDFGGGKTRDLASSTAAPASKPPAPRPAPALDQPVSKSERFAEDFDRSWPRSAQQAAEEAARVPELRKRESDRVLFNASSNRLEPPSSRGPQPQQPPPQPTRLMSRPDTRAPPPHLQSDSAAHVAPGPSAGRNLQRQPPPHLAGAADAGRQLPPHMADAAASRPPPPPAQAARTPWGQHRDAERQLPPHLAQRPEMPPQSAAFEAAARSPTSGPGSALPPRRSFGQATAPPAPQVHAQPTPAAPVADPTDSQAAEMHSAAEKARLRREAEEVERKAAAERAKQKARELEARLGLTSAARSPATETVPAPPAVAATPSYTIAQRPKPPAETAPPVPAAHAPAPAGPAHLAVRPQVEQRRSQEDQWRRQPQHAPVAAATPVQAAVPPHQQGRLASTSGRPGRPTAESFFETSAPPSQQPVAQAAEHLEAGPSTQQLLHAEAELLLDELAGEASAKKDYMFDDTLARIKAVMNQSAAASSADNKARHQDSRRRTSDSQVAQPAAPSAKSAAPPPRIPDMPEFFEVTQAELPRSPPPAWRTYVVKIPQDQKARPTISQTQISALQRTRRPARGWLLSFEPPLDLPNQSLSRTDLLIPGPNLRRSSRKDATPLVNISRNKLEPFQHEVKPQASTSATASRSDFATTHAAPAGHQAQSRSSGMWRATEEASLLAPEPVATQATVDLLDSPLPKARPSARTATAAVPLTTKSSNLYEVAGNDNSLRNAIPAASDPKSGVRFMVSSELEGDSLLDEVNKMSLDTVEEAGGKARSNAAGANTEAPRSPVAHGTASAPRTHPSSPNGTVPWNSSHEHLKNVWQAPGQQQQQPSEAQPAATPTAPDPAALTPVFPSLNAPSVADPPAAASQTKLSYASQTFSPTSAAFTSLRQSPGPGIGYSSSPATPADGLGAMGYSRQHTGANGYSAMGQQGLWSTPFSSASVGTSGYGYPAKSTNAMDQKAAMAFNTAGGAASAYQYGGQATGYSSLAQAQSPYAQGQYSTHQGQQHRMASAQNGAYGYQPYGQASQLQGGRSSRFGQPNGGADYGHLDGGYYGYVGGGGGQAGQANQSHGMYYTSSGTAVGQGGTRPQHGAHQTAGQRNKMW